MTTSKDTIITKRDLISKKKWWLKATNFVILFKLCLDQI